MLLMGEFRINSPEQLNGPWLPHMKKDHLEQLASPSPENNSSHNLSLKGFM